MNVGVVDIGTNSMRLLITDGLVEAGRWSVVTGLGKGVDATGLLSDAAMEKTLLTLSDFGRLMDDHRVERRVAIATSASREAANREVFFDQAESAIGVRPALISGEQEAKMAYKGALSGVDGAQPVLVSDIGGGSTELVTHDWADSIDVGTVRLSERILRERPPSETEMRQASDHLSQTFEVLEPGEVRTHIGVAGTWTSLSAMAQNLPAHRRDEVHGSSLCLDSARGLVERLSRMTLEETRAIASLDPNRAPVILAGSMIAVAVMTKLGVTTTIVSKRDTLDAAAMELIGIP